MADLYISTARHFGYCSFTSLHLSDDFSYCRRTSLHSLTFVFCFLELQAVSLPPPPPLLPLCSFSHLSAPSSVLLTHYICKMFIFTLVQVIASDRRSLPRPAHSSSQIFPITSLYQIFCRWHLWAVILLFCFCDIFFILYVWIFLTLLPSFISPCFWYFDISEDFLLECCFYRWLSLQPKSYFNMISVLLLKCYFDFMTVLWS